MLEMWVNHMICTHTFTVTTPTQNQNLNLHSLNLKTTIIIIISKIKTKQSVCFFSNFLDYNTDTFCKLVSLIIDNILINNDYKL